MALTRMRLDAIQRNPLLATFRMACADEFGEAMTLWFAVAEGLYLRGEDVPTEWQFRPSPLFDSDSFDEHEWAEENVLYAQDVLDMIDNGDADSVLYVGRVMTRYVNLVKLAGKDY